MSVYVSGTPGFPRIREVTATSSTNTTSSTDALLNSMTTGNLPQGTYLILFNADFESNAAGAAISFSYYLGGSQVATSLRKIIPFDGGALSATAARGIAQLQQVITVSGAQAVEVRWSISSGTATAAARSLISMQVAQI